VMRESVVSAWDIYIDAHIHDTYQSWIVESSCKSSGKLVGGGGKC
jgi:hypothetical protein